MGLILGALAILALAIHTLSAKKDTTPKIPSGGVVGGYDAARAAQLAPLVLADIEEKGKDYNRTALEAFQAASGITVDGYYGGESAGALQWWLAKTGVVAKVPAPIFRPKEIKPYTPRG